MKPQNFITLSLCWLHAIAPAQGQTPQTPRIDFVTDNKSLFDLDLAMGEHYLALSQKNSLPVQLVKDDIGLQPRLLMVGLGLLAAPTGYPAIARPLEQLLCELNKYKCRSLGNGKFEWNNSKGDTLCLPNVNWSDSLKISRIPTPSTSDLQSTLDAEYGVCAIYGSRCSSAVEKLRSTRLPDGTMEVVVFTQAAYRPTDISTNSCSNATAAPASSRLTERGKEILLRLGIKVSTQSGSTWVINSTPAAAKGMLAPGIGKSQRTSPFAGVAAAPRGAQRPGTSNFGTFSSLTSKHLLQDPHQTIYNNQAQAYPSASKSAPMVPNHIGISSLGFALNPGSAMSVGRGMDSAHQEHLASGTLSSPIPRDLAAVVPSTSGFQAEFRASTSISNSLPSSVAGDPKPDALEALIDKLQNVNGSHFEKINLPKSSGFTDLMAPFRASVLVIDTQLNVCHAALRPSILKEFTEQTCTQAQSLRGVYYREGNKPDHGNHVAGLIAGRYVGVDPRIHIFPIAAVDDSWILDDQTYGLVSKGIAEAMMKLDEVGGPRVANFSADLKLSAPTTQKITNLISTKQTMLFVAAAGNDGESLDTVCNVMPACTTPSGFTNLLVVGGAYQDNGQWKRWNFSRYGSRVDILAPAEKLTSALKDDDHFGAMSGTSQSTALTSAVAARLIGDSDGNFGHTILGAQVRNRLMATANITPELANATRSGVIDAGRALNVNTQTLYLQNPNEVLKGRILKILDTKSNDKNDSNNGDKMVSTIEFINKSNRTVSLDFCSIYRLSKFSDNSWFVAAQPEGLDDGPRWAKMEIHRDLTLDTSDRIFHFLTEEGKRIIFSLDRLTGFYDKFSWSDAC